MPDDPLASYLESVLDDPDARPSTKVKAATELARLRRAEAPSSSSAEEPAAAMAALVESFCPELPEMRDMAADPMRDLDFAAIVGHVPDPVFVSWVPYCPANAAKAERAIVAAARRLGVGMGPHDLPQKAGDELTTRRRRSAG